MSAVPPSRTQPLLCQLGWHRPDPIARWNDGYYFTRCRRCGRDLVRTLYGRWQVPRGFRVVWDSRRPDSAISAELVLTAEDQGGEDSKGLPIQSVLQHLRDEASPEAAGAPQNPSPRRARTYLPDFMDDANADTSWRAHCPRRGPAGPAAPSEAAPPAPSSSGSKLSNMFRRSAGVDIPESPGRPILAAGGVTVLILVLLLAAGGGNPASAPVAESRAIVPASADGQPVYVATGAVSCLTEPYAQAAHVRRLVRGDSVDLIATVGDWARISYAGEQCWMPARHLSAGMPV